MLHMIPLLAEAEADVSFFHAAGVTIAFGLICAGILVAAHFFFHFVLKKFSHGIDFEQEIKKGNIAAAIVYAASEFVFVGGIAAVLCAVS